MSLLNTATKGMGDAAPDPDTAQTVNDWVVGFAGMNHHRQLGMGGQFELFLEQNLLLRPIQIGKKKIQADLPYRHRSDDGNESFQFDQVPGLVPFKKNGMQAQGRKESFLAPTKVDKSLPTSGMDPRYQDAIDSNGSGLSQYLVPVQVKLGDVQVAMSVDHHESSKGSGSGWVSTLPHP